MAKRVQKKKALTRKQVSRVEREKRQKRNIIIGTVSVVAVLVLLMLMGLYQSQIAEPRAERARQTATAEVAQATREAAETMPVVTVHGTMISLADWQARVRYERYLTIRDIYQYESQIASLDTSSEFGQQLVQFFQAEAQSLRNQLDLGDVLAGEVLDQMVEEDLIRQEAQRRGVTVTPQEVQEYIEVMVFNYPYPPTPVPDPRPTATLSPDITPSPTLTPSITPTPVSREDFEAYYQGALAELSASLGMTEERWKDMFEAIIYTEKLLDLFGQEIEAVQPQVKIDYISVQDLTQATELLERLEAGEPFADLFQEITDDQVITTTTGSRDWSVIGDLSASFGPDFEKAAFNIPPGNFVSDVIMGSGGDYYLIYVQEAEERALSSEAFERQKDAKLESWLSTAKVSDEIVYGDWQSFVPMDPALSEFATEGSP